MIPFNHIFQLCAVNSEILRLTVQTHELLRRSAEQLPVQGDLVRHEFLPALHAHMICHFFGTREHLYIFEPCAGTVVENISFRFPISS